MSDSQAMVNFGVALDMVPGPDNTIWPRMQIINNVTAMVVTLPAEQFEQFMERVHSEWLKMRTQVREENSPLKKATVADLQRINGPRQ